MSAVNVVPSWGSVSVVLATPNSRDSVVWTYITYPLAIKIDDPTISHKPDQGGVVVGINSYEELEQAYFNLKSKLI